MAIFDHPTALKRWYGKFHRGLASLSNVAHQGLPATAVPGENIDAVQHITEN